MEFNIDGLIAQCEAEGLEKVVSADMPHATKRMRIQRLQDAGVIPKTIRVGRGTSYFPDPERVIKRLRMFNAERLTGNRHSDAAQKVIEQNGAWSLVDTLRDYLRRAEAGEPLECGAAKEASKC